jgi:uncharacterized protein YbbC (DUF1343 family)
MYYNLLITFIFILSLSSCAPGGSSPQMTESDVATGKAEVRPGAWQTAEYLSELQGRKIGMVVNHTSTIGAMHTVDSLLALGIDIRKIFAPEHGFRGQADAGDHISDEKDPETGISIVSLYGEKQEPSAQDLAELDLIVFDIQDVGARFYTFISTLHYVMNACARYQKPLIVFDRPNPNSHYIDGPIREEAFKSFVGMHPVPVVYGMTIGEYAQLINGEGWLDNASTCQLRVIKCHHYDHETMYPLPVAPSPNLPNLRSILLYPSLCYFEGTPLSIGRGTTTQFQVIGHPDIPDAGYEFTPKSMFGAARPKLENQLCHGVDLTVLEEEDIFRQRQINLNYVIDFYRKFPDKSSFFNANGWFDRLAGTTSLREQIVAGKTADEIRASWQPGLAEFNKIRTKYLLYP